MARKAEYKSKAVTTSIKFTSRASIKISTRTGDAFYTVEACEERLIPAIDGVDLNKERQLLWDTVNMECDKQIEDIQQSYVVQKQSQK